MPVPETSMTTSELMSAVAAGASAIAGIAAAYAAFRSAKSSEESRKLAESVELRSLLREISTVVAAARAEHMCPGQVTSHTPIGCSIAY